MSPSAPGPIVFALLVDRDSEAMRAAQLERLAAYAEPALRGEVEEILPMVHPLTPELRLPLVSMVVPTLRRLSRDQFEAFAAGVRELIQADNQVSLYEYALHRLLLRHLARHFGFAPPSAEPWSIGRTPGRTGAARPGGPGPDRQRAAVGRGPCLRPGNPGPGLARESIPRLPPRDLDLQALDHALNELDAAAPPLKRQILDACAACIGADGRVTLEEGELLRADRRLAGMPDPPLQSLAGAEVVGVNPPE